MRSRYSAGSFGCPTAPHCTELRPACGTSVAAPLAWPCLPLDRHTGHSNMVNTCLRDCSEPNCPALWDLYVCHRDFTRQLLWALWRHVMSCLSRSSPDRASSSANPPEGGASPTGGRNLCFAFCVFGFARASCALPTRWAISPSDSKLYIFL